MRKLLLFLFAITATMTSFAHHGLSADSVALKEYTGRYVFPDGSAVTEINVTIESGLLYASSEQGSSELKQLEKDVFEVVAYTGKATFKRDENGKVSGVYVVIGDMIMDGRKADD